MNHLFMTDDDKESLAGQTSIKSSLMSMRSFDLPRSQLVCSGFMSKKSRGRRMVGKLFDNTRKRWFELRVDPTGDGGIPAYAVLYYKAKDDKKPKGEVMVSCDQQTASPAASPLDTNNRSPRPQLSPFDSILQNEDNLCELTLQLDRDTETSHQMLQLVAPDEECANAWAEAFHGSIVNLNRLTAIKEGDDEDRITSVRGVVGRMSLMENGKIGEERKCKERCEAKRRTENLPVPPLTHGALLTARSFLVRRCRCRSVGQGRPQE